MKPTFKKWTEWEEGDSLVGKVTKVNKDVIVKGKNYGHRFIMDLIEVHLTNNDGKYQIKTGMKFEIGCGVITSQYEDGEFEIGDVCQFKYKGQKTSKTGDNYHVVTVVPAPKDIPAPMDEEENLGDDDL